MTPTEVLKMLKSKIDAAGMNKCSYAIETSDIEAINQALLLYGVSGMCEHDYVRLIHTTFVKCSKCADVMKHWEV